MRTLEYYNLDAIISVGYRVKSRVATQFRIWATQRLYKQFVENTSFRRFVSDMVYALTND